MSRLVLLFACVIVATPAAAADLRLGLVGTDSSHVTAFASVFNDPSSAQHVAGARIVAAYRGGSPDLPSSRDRIDKFATDLKDKYGVEIVGSISELCARVDGVLLTSVDGRVHLAQARESSPRASRCSSTNRSRRRSTTRGRLPGWRRRQAFRGSARRRSAMGLARSRPRTSAALRSSAPALSRNTIRSICQWYAIHEAEMLFALLGRGCEEVTRVASADADVVTCRWSDGRIGTMRALRPYSDYGAVIFRKDANGRHST